MLARKARVAIVCHQTALFLVPGTTSCCVITVCFDFAQHLSNVQVVAKLHSLHLDPFLPVGTAFSIPHFRSGFLIASEKPITLKNTRE